MATIFKSKIQDFEEQDLNSSTKLHTMMTGILVRDIKCSELDLKVWWNN